MVNIDMFRHPKYYKELRRAGVQVNSSRPAHSRCNKSDQVISSRVATASARRAPGPGLKLGEMDIASSKQQASSAKQQVKPKPVRVQRASSIKRQASSPEQQASSAKPQATSSEILEPRNKKTEKVFLGKGPRAFTMINVLSG